MSLWQELIPYCKDCSDIATSNLLIGIFLGGVAYHLYRKIGSEDREYRELNGEIVEEIPSEYNTEDEEVPPHPEDLDEEQDDDLDADYEEDEVEGSDDEEYDIGNVLHTMLTMQSMMMQKMMGQQMQPGASSPDQHQENSREEDMIRNVNPVTFIPGDGERANTFISKAGGGYAKINLGEIPVQQDYPLVDHTYN